MPATAVDQAIILQGYQSTTLITQGYGGFSSGPNPGPPGLGVYPDPLLASIVVVNSGPDPLMAIIHLKR